MSVPAGPLAGSGYPRPQDCPTSQRGWVTSKASILKPPGQLPGLGHPSTSRHHSLPTCYNRHSTAPLYPCQPHSKLSPQCTLLEHKSDLTASQFPTAHKIKIKLLPCLQASPCPPLLQLGQLQLLVPRLRLTFSCIFYPGASLPEGLGTPHSTGHRLTAAVPTLPRLRLTTSNLQAWLPRALCSPSWVICL